MLLVKEIVRSIFDEIKGTFVYSWKDAEVMNQELRDKKVKAKEVPLKCYIRKKGTSLQYSMAMIYRLRQNNIKAYLGIYKGEGLHSDEVKDDYAFVMYREGFLRWYIADLEPQNPQDNILNPARIKIKSFKKLKGKLWLYNPYDDKRGSKLIFDGFFEKPEWIIK